MERKRPFGLKAFLILKMLFGSAILFLASFMYLDVLQNSGLRIPWLEKIRLALFPAYVIFYLITCVSLFKLKKWARWVSVILDASIILYLLPAPIRDIRNFFRYGAAPLAVWEALWPFALDLFLLVLLFWFIYYLARPQAGSLDNPAAPWHKGWPSAPLLGRRHYPLIKNPNSNIGIKKNR